MNTEVLIAGAGPTGLALAATLADAGIDHRDRDRALLRLRSDTPPTPFACLLTRMATAKSAPKQFMRNLVLRVVNLHPMARRRFDMNLSALACRAAAEYGEWRSR